MRRVIVADFIARACGIEAFAQHQAAGFLKTHLLLKLQRTHRGDGLEVVMQARYAHPNARHYGGDSLAALPALREAERYFELAERPAGLANCLRFRAEILSHLGKVEEALEACCAAVELHRSSVLDPRGPEAANALFWKGSTLVRLNRFEEAESCINEALSLWQDMGDKTGVGFCSRMLGRLRAEQGRFAEARLHIDHAILLHEMMNDGGSRRAAVETGADVFVKAGRPLDALPWYEECLQSFEAAEDVEQRSEKGAERIRVKIERAKIECTKIQQCQSEEEAAQEARAEQKA